MKYDDTIVAIMTATGAGAIGVIRVSGTDALPIAQEVVHLMRARAWRPWRVHYGHVYNTQGTVIDEVLVTYMRAPRSYTGEDVVEISCHGGRIAIELVLQRVLAAGARLADPGEFTMRAFVSGRIDLSQAEAVLDVIQAQTPVALAVAQSQLRGGLGDEIRQLRGQILYELAAVVARIDFPDEVEESAVDQVALAAVDVALTRMLQQAQAGMRLRDGATVVLLGKPNVGKSSLLNVLLRHDRAIVSPIAGTTRDTLSEYADILGVPVRLIDTAGIHDQSNDPIEQLGIARSRQVATEADVALVLIDRSRSLDADDQVVISACGSVPAILVLTKVDLTPDPQTPTVVVHQVDARWLSVVEVSPLTGAGIAELRQVLHDVLLGHAPAADVRVSNSRHIDALRRCQGALRDAITGMHHSLSADLIAVDLQAAVAALGEITGEDVSESILDTVFARFCIGK
jgi:tRNA modification GTPase